MAEFKGRAAAIRLLCEMQQKLLAEGESRYPRRGDFSDAEVMQIKAYLGPWPRALEAAQLKPPRQDTTHRRTVEKRVRANKHHMPAVTAEQQSMEDDEV